MKLIIVESPTKSKTLSRFLGKDYRLVATMGHIRDLPPKKIGIKIKGKDSAYSFVPEYVLVAQKSQAIKQLKAEAQKAVAIYLAVDPDREGESIAWHTAQILRGIKNLKAKDKISRISFHEITQSAIEKALAEPGEINLELVNAQQARRVLDRLVGYKLSPLLWFKIRRGLSAGRVQSVAVRLIVDREREIEKFVAEEYWEIWARLRRHLGGLRPGAPIFKAKLEKINGQKAAIEKESQAGEIVAELKKANYEVLAVDKKEVQQSPPPPFTTSTLQQKAAVRFRFPARRTMRLAQSLYEKGLITYHRTDSLALSAEAVSRIRGYIYSNYTQKYLPEKPRFFKTKSRVAQEAHEAIRPTQVSTSPSQAGQVKGLNQDELRLYTLVWQRAVACQMAAAVWDQTRLETQATSAKNIYLFLSEGKVIKFDGWLKLYGLKEVAEKGEQLPELKKGDDLDLIELLPEQKFTQPPARYTEATLIRTLEEKGIGRPSTYAPIVSVIQVRQYVEKEEDKFRPTPLGTTVNDFLVEYFPTIVDYQFTAQMEEDLDEIANGKKDWQKILSDFYGPFNQKLLGVKEVAERAKVPAEVTDEECPECKKKGLSGPGRGQLVIRIGRFGKFLSCSRFPECKYTAPFTPRLEGVNCPKCGGEIVIKKTKKGKQFYGCSNWPKCDFASWRKPKK